MMIQLCEAEPNIRLNSGHNMKYNTLLEANLEVKQPHQQMWQPTQAFAQINKRIGKA
jgi:hypothetical protein